MIPKVIHYCWFGKGKKPKEILHYIAGWKRMHPGYLVIEWNEDNFDVHCNAYVYEAYKAQKWAFVTDYVRLYALYHMGGIYLDTDVEVLKPLTPLLTDNGVLGFECVDCIMTGFMAAQKGSPVIHDLMGSYESRHFNKKDGGWDMTTNVSEVSKYFIQHGLAAGGKKQRVGGFTIYPQRFFSPNTLGMVIHLKPRGAYMIHHFFGSWAGSNHVQTVKSRIFHYFGGKVRNLIGTSRYRRLRKLDDD